MVIVTQEMGFPSEVGDSVFFMGQGRIVEENTAEELFQGPQHDRTKNFLF